MPTLYTFGNAANVSANNFTTLYNSGAGVVNPQLAYGNANVVGLLAAGTDGGNTVGNIIAVGNISGNYFLGNGALLTGLPATYSNANVAAYLASGADSANIITTGNVSGTYILGNGSQLTGLPATYGNANVAAFLPTYTGNLSGGNLAITKDAVVSGNITTGLNMIAGGSVQATGNIRTTGPSGNITGANYISAQFFVGDGGMLSNVTGGYSNANVAAYLASGSDTSNIITTANIAGSYLLGNGAFITGLPASYSNANVASFLTTYTGNIAAGNLSTTGNVTVSGNLISDDITSTGVTVYGDQIITGNLTVQGNTTTINSNVITTNDKTITVANNQSTQANVDGAGIDAGNPAIATWYYNALTNSWQSNVSITPIANLVQTLGTNTNRWLNAYVGNIDITNNATAGNFIGNGSQLTSINASNVVGNVTSALNASTLRVPVKNTSGGTLAAGTPIYATGTVGATDTLEVSASRADTAATMAAIGLLETALANNAEGYAVSIGALSGQDTSTYTVGQELYVAAAGGLTASRPTGSNVVQTVGTVGRVNASTGTIEVNIWNKNPLPNLSSGKIWQGNATGYPTETTPYGNSDVAVYLASGTDTANIITTGNIKSGNLSVTGTVHADGNIVTPNYIDTNTGITFGAFSSRITESSSVINVYTGNILQFAISSAGVNVSNVGFNVANTISASGNITGSYFLGNGSQLTGLPATYSNAQVAAYLASGTDTSNIITTANISGSYILGNGSQLTGLPATYGNANVATFLAAYGANTFSSTGTITAGNITGGNILTGGLFSATGNITSAGNIAGSYFIGNGSQLTGITAVSTNPAFANVIVAGQSNIAAGNVSGSFTLVAGTNMTITTDAPNNKITLASSGGGGGGGTLSGNLAGDIYANAYAITSLANGNVTITANGTGLVNISNANFQSYREVYYSAGSQTGNLAANINIANGSIQAMTLTGNVTLNTLPTMAAGQNITLIMTQDATGNRILTSTMKYAGAYKTLSTAASSTDILSIFYDGTNYWASLNIGYA